MLAKTHLAITLFFVLLFINVVNNQIVFTAVALIVTMIPDIDSKDSKLGSKLTFRPLQFLLGHRGVLHSFIFLIIATLFFAFFIPILAFPFFLGYGVHLIADSFTVQGIRPFYPWRKTISGKIRTGGKSETSIFTIFILADVLLFLLKVIH